MKGMISCCRYARRGYQYHSSTASSSPMLRNMTMIHCFSTNSGDGNEDNRAGGSGDRSDRVKGSMDNFLRQAKNKVSNDEKKPWSQLLNNSSDPSLSSSGGGAGGSQGSGGFGDRKNEKKRNKPMLDDEILASLDQDDQYDSDYSPSDAELYRQANDAVIDEYNPQNIGINSDETFLPSDLEEEADGPQDDRELEELVDTYLDPTPEKVKTMESTSADDDDQHLSDFEVDSKNDKTAKALRKFNEGVEYFESKSRRRGRRRDESEEEELETLYDELRNVSSTEEGGAGDQEKEDGYASDDPPGYQFEDEELSMLDAYDKIEDMGRQGLGFSYEGERDMDPFEEFIGNALQESVKTSTGIVWGTIEMEGTEEKRKRIRIPHPRSTRQLARAVTPQIRAAPPGTIGHDVAAEAWVELSKNPYWTQEMKVEGCNYIAKEIESILKPRSWELSAEETESILNTPEGKKQGSLPVGVDHKGQPVDTWWPRQAIDRELTLDFNFRPGPDAIEKEQIEEQKRMEEAQRALAMTTKQEATDWSVQAVVDEDELFK